MQNIYAYGRIMAGDEDGKKRLNVIRDMQVPEEQIFLDYPTKEKRSNGCVWGIYSYFLQAGTEDEEVNDYFMCKLQHRYNCVNETLLTQNFGDEDLLNQHLEKNN